MQKHEDNIAAPTINSGLQPLAGVSVAVTLDSTGLAASLYSDDGVTPLAQPLVTDDDGYYAFYAANEEYTATFSSSRIETFTRKIILNDPSDNQPATLAQLAAAAGDSLVGHIASGTGAVATTVQQVLRETMSAFRFMTTAQIASVQAGAYSLNVGVALQAAIDAAYAQKLPLEILGGGYLHSGLTFYPGMVIVGAGSRIVTLKLADGANVDVMKAQNAYTLFGTASSSGTNGWHISGLTLDGNKTNQSPADNNACNGLAYYGCDYILEDVVITNIKGHGIRSEWYQYGENAGGIEASMRDVTIDTVGRHGWWFRGPHDHYTESLIVIDASAETDNTYCGVYTDTYGNGRFVNLHTWHRAATTNRMKFGMSSGGANELIECHFEGGRGQLEHRGTGDRVVGSNFYAHAGAALSAMVVFAANENIHSACRYTATTAQSCYALEFKSSASGNRVDGYFGNFDLLTPFNFSADGGLNTIVGQGYCAASGATSFGGSLSASSSVDYYQGGTVIASSPNLPSGASRAIKIGGVTALLVDSSLRWLKKAASAITFGSTTPSVQIHGTTNDESNLGIANWEAGTTTAILRFLKSRGATVGSHGLVASGDVVANIDGFASDGASYNRIARIRFIVDGATGAGDTPGRIVFSTSPDGAAADIDRAIIDNAGNFAMQTAGTGLRIKEGSNAKQGTSTLVAGAATVANTSVTASSRILLTSNADSGTPGFLRVSARVAGTSFTITSSSGTDTSTVAWQIFEPA